MYVHRMSAGALLLATLSAYSVGCSKSDSPTTQTTSTTCSNSETRGADGRCHAIVVPAVSCDSRFVDDGAGGCTPILPPAPCGEGHVGVIGKTECQPVGVDADWAEPTVNPAVGVPSGGCGNGFTHDNSYGCSAVLPDSPCDFGTMATPGESTCRPVMDCGDGPWGLLSPDLLGLASTLFVDRNYDGSAGPSDGSQARPFTTIQNAVDASELGAVIAITDGDYKENLVITTHPVKLWGRCPDRVSIRGTLAPTASIHIENTDGVEVHGVRVSGDTNFAELVIIDALDVLLDRIRVDGGLHNGVLIQRSNSSTRAVIQGSLIESTHEAGVWVISADVTIAGSVIRSTQEEISDQLYGYGVEVEATQASGPGSLTMTASVVEQNRSAGVFLSGSNATISTSVIRDTRSEAASSAMGFGVMATLDAGGLPSSVSLDQSVLLRNRDVGILALGSTATIERTVVRDMLPRETDSFGGRGVEGDGNGVNARATVSVSESLIERAIDVGVFVGDGDLTLTSTAVVSTQPCVADQGGGSGVSVQSIGGARSSLDADQLWLDHNSSIGLFVLGSDAKVTRAVINDTHVRASDGVFGEGIIAKTTEDGKVATLSLEDAVLSANHTEGIGLVGAKADVRRVVIRDGLPDSSGSFGRAIEMMPAADGRPSELSLDDSLLDANRSSALFVRGSVAKLTNTIVRGTTSNPNDTDGRGINVQFERQSSDITLDRCTIDANQEAGIFVSGSTATLRNSLVRDTQPSTATSNRHGTGIAARSYDSTPSAITVVASLLTRNHSSGLNLFNASATLRETEISSTLPVDGGGGGRGIQIVRDSGTPATLSLEATSVRSNTEAGISIFGASAELVASWIDSTSSSLVDGSHGVGIVSQGVASRGSLSIRSSRISSNHRAGVLCAISDATIDDTTIVDTLAETGTQKFGDGVIAVQSAVVTIRSSEIDRSERAAASTFGATISLGDVKLGCNAVAIGEEALHSGDFGYVGDDIVATVTDEGGNVCVCDGVFSRCTVSTSTLVPPAPVAPLGHADPSDTASIEDAK